MPKPSTSYKGIDNRDLKMLNQSDSLTQKAKRFCAVWETAKSPSDAAQKLNMSYDAAKCYARFMRHKGVPLKKFPKRRRQIDLSAVKSYHDSIRKKA